MRTFFAIIGFLVVALVVGTCAACNDDDHANSLGPAVTSHHDRDGDSGGEYGNGNDQRKCYRGENCRGSFSPGPFDRSPVDIHDNCISLDCGNRGSAPPPG